MDQYLSLDNKDACRLCMRQKGYISIFNSIDSMKICDRLKHIVQIQIAEDDGLPQSVCEKCNLKLDSAYNFKMQVEEVNAYLCQNQTSIKYEIEPFVKKEENSDEDANSSRRSPSPTLSVEETKFSDTSHSLEEIVKKSTREPKDKKVSNFRSRHKCTICLEMFHSVSGLQRHGRLTHRITRSKSKDCDRNNIVKRTANLTILPENNIDYNKRLCTKDLDKPILQNGTSHRVVNDVVKSEETRTNFKKFECKLCFKQYQFHYGLKGHLCKAKLKSKELFRKFICEQCGRTFKHHSVLQQHMNTHKEVKEFSCELCKKMFSRSSHLVMHIRIHNNVKPYVCETCGKSFTKSSDLRRHCRIHSDVRNYSCSHCSKKFKRSGDVTSHMRSHTGDRPYKCNTCDKTYSSHSSLRKHQRTTTGCFTSKPQNKMIDETNCQNKVDQSAECIPRK